MNCFGTGREHKLNLLCGLLGALDSKWMSGSARAGTISREANTANGEVLISSRSAPSGARQEILCFFVDFDLHGCRQHGSHISVNIPWISTGIRRIALEPNNCRTATPSAHPDIPVQPKKKNAPGHAVPSRVTAN
jgi:hypothetical protein